MTTLAALSSLRPLNFTLKALTRARKAALVAALGCGSLFVGVQGAIAADTVTLELDSGELTITIGELANFAETGELSSEAQEFFDTNRQDAPTLQRLISEDVVVGSDIEEFFDTSTGEFVLIQLDKLVSRSPNEATLDALRTALRTSYEDNGRFSILEIAEAYPEPNIYLDLRGLETVYDDVKTFVERIRPALEAAKLYLQELICDCESAPSTPAPEPRLEPETETDGTDTEETETEDTSSSLPLSTEQSALPSRECNTPTATAPIPAEVQDAETATSVSLPTNSL